MYERASSILHFAETQKLLPGIGTILQSPWSQTSSSSSAVIWLDAFIFKENIEIDLKRGRLVGKLESTTFSAPTCYHSNIVNSRETWPASRPLDTLNGGVD